jgi:hypothetical protein
MPLITDPDTLTFEVTDTVTGTYMLTVRPTTKLLKLTIVGALSADGVTVQCLYSKLKEVWLSQNLPYDFPMESIFDEQFEFVNEWRPADDSTRNLFRSAGWAERASGTIVREYANMTTLGSFGAAEQAYYSNQSGVTTNFVYTGPVNEGVQIYGGASDGNFNRRSSFTAYLRIQGKAYDSYDLLTGQSLSSLTYKKYGVPLANATDSKITVSDGDIDTLAPYTGMTFGRYTTSQETDGAELPNVLAGGTYSFGVVIDANGGTSAQVYNWYQRQLRKGTDIDAVGTLIGTLAGEALEFVGDTLYTRPITNASGGGTGVFVTDLDSNSVNSIFFSDNSYAVPADLRNYPFTAAGTLVFDANLQADADAEYWMYFTTLPGAGNDYGESGAVLVDNASAVDITGLVSANPTIAWSFAYDTNTQGGRTAGTDAAVTVIAIGKATAKFVKATHTITRSTGQTISLVAALERSYLNP